MQPRNRSTLTFGLIALVLSGSLALNVVLALALQESFAKLQFARIFPLGFSGDAAEAPIGRTALRSISFWGDSRAALWDKAELANSLSVHDFAHGGATSTQLLLQLLGQPLERTDVAVVQIGINDLHPLGALPANKAQVLEQLRRNILLVREALLARSDVVVLTTLFPPGPVPLWRRLAWDPATLQYVNEVNEQLRRAADGQRVLLLDAHALLGDGNGLLSSRYADGDFFLHVNAEAYSLLNDRLKEMLRLRLPARN